MKAIADLHTHTNASKHAHSTLMELCSYANKIGLKALAVTDHGPAIPDGMHEWRFVSYTIFVPRMIEDVFLIRGAEANILQPDGRLDVPNHILKKLDMVIASLHNETCLERDPKKITEILLDVIENPLVDILGHLGTPTFDFEHETVIKKAKKYDKVIEVNNNSFYSRKGSKENCEDIAKLCMKYEVPISVNSDAHFAYNVGDLGIAMEMLEKINFPEELIINSSMDNLRNYFLKKGKFDMYEEMKKGIQRA